MTKHNMRIFGVIPPFFDLQNNNYNSLNGKKWDVGYLFAFSWHF